MEGILTHMLLFILGFPLLQSFTSVATTYKHQFFVQSNLSSNVFKVDSTHKQIQMGFILKCSLIS